MYKITLTIGDKTVVGKGEAAVDALQALPHPGKLMAKGVLTITDGTRENTINMNPVHLKRLFYNSPGIQAVRAKQLMMGLQ